jgi:bacteriorhodopsin
MRPQVFQMGVVVRLNFCHCQAAPYTNHEVSAYGSVACTGIGFQIFSTGYSLALAKGRKFRVQYLRCSLLMTTLWLGYGIVWPLGEGANVISPDVEGVLYGILDILGCVVFGAMVTFYASQYSVEG